MKTKAFFTKLILLIFVLSFTMSCENQESQQDHSSLQHPEWSVNANIYEVNTRQYTEEGTFEAFSEHLERLSELGIDILWFMPVTPIGEKNRKGTLGSYYSVKNYTEINPEFGNLDDFKEVVRKAHELGMRVIIDWVANHTAWDHEWTETNPEFYVLDEEGNFTAPNDDWTDVIQLDYNNPELWDAMIDEMKFWVEEANVDGFRCDVAYMVPTDFWNRATEELMELKKVFMLAEADSPELHEKAFHAGYGWHLHHLMNQIAKGEATVSDIDKYFFEDNQGNYPVGSYKIYFTSNHDENTWNGTAFERLGDGAEAFSVLSATVPGTILIYNGQEAGLDKRLDFFEKDLIDWSDLSYQDFYKPLLNLKRNNKALWNGEMGADIERVKTNCDDHIFAFTREKYDEKVFVILNLSDLEIDVEFEGDNYQDKYFEIFTQQYQTIDENALTMPPWGYLVLER